MYIVNDSFICFSINMFLLNKLNLIHVVSIISVVFIAIIIVVYIILVFLSKLLFTVIYNVI